MDGSERYRKEQDVVFQGMEEKALIQKQAIILERSDELLRKIKAAQVADAVISEMMDAGKTFAEVIEFLEAEISKNAIEDLVRSLMTARAAAGKPISEERARELVGVSMAEEE